MTPSYYDNGIDPARRSAHHAGRARNREPSAEQASPGPTGRTGRPAAGGPQAGASGKEATTDDEPRPKHPVARAAREFSSPVEPRAMWRHARFPNRHASRARPRPSLIERSTLWPPSEAVPARPPPAPGAPPPCRHSRLPLRSPAVSEAAEAVGAEYP